MTLQSGIFAAVLMTVLGSSVFAEAGPETGAEEEAALSEDGLWVEPWLLESFLILPEDQQDALADGKRLMMVWEQRGCPYCTMLHQINFADPEIRKELMENFAVLQLNKYGSRRMIDFDGEEMEERHLAAKYRVLFTPTVQFFTLDMDAIDASKARAAEVTRMPGYLPPAQFLAFLHYVKDEKFRTMSFREYLGPGTELKIDGTPVD